MEKAIVQLVVLVPAFLIFGLILLTFKFKTGRPIHALGKDNPQLFGYALGTALAVLFVVFAIFVALNN